MHFESKVMNLNNIESTPFLTYKEFEKISFINHCFSTRLGGVSSGEFESLNLSFGRGDSDENVIANYKLICKSANLDFDTLVASAQVHEDNVRCVTKNEIGIGITKPKDLKSVDALVTNEKNVTLVTYYADCTPVFFIDENKKAIGLAHAGWRSTVLRISAKVIETMAKNYGSNPQDIKVAIGPAISKCCYEVDNICFDNFKNLKEIDLNKIATKKENGKYMLDLLEANKEIILNAGVKAENIIISDLCTKCNSDLLWSHRATNGKRGTLSAFMCIK